MLLNLNSCSTGKEKGEGLASIAHIMRDNLNDVTVDAPKINTSSRDIPGKNGFTFKPYFAVELGPFGIHIGNFHKYIGPIRHKNRLFGRFAKVRYQGTKMNSLFLLDRAHNTIP